MENMNFYQIQIGRITRAGNMDALHSFVCRTNNSNRSNVYNHFVKKYSGLNIICDPIKEVITEEIIKVKEDFDYVGSKEDNSLRDRIKELESKTKESNVISDEIHSGSFPEESIVLIKEMRDLTSQRAYKRKEAESIIKKHLHKAYSPFVNEIRFPEILQDNQAWLKYKVILKGKLKVDFEKPE